MNKDEAKKIARNKLIALNPEMATVFAMQDLKESMDSGSKSTLESLRIENMLEKLKTKGEDGYTPIKGIDYEDGHTPTDEELISLIKPLIPEIRQPEDGKTPTKEELLSLIKPLIPKVKDGETPSDERLIGLIKGLIPEYEEETAECIADKLNTLDNAIDVKVIRGIPTLEEITKGLKGKLDISDIKNGLWNQPGKGKQDLRWHGGGISSIIAGSGITAVDDGSGHITVSAPGSTTDEKVKISSTDTTPNYLQQKLLAGSGISITKNNSPGNETLTIAANDSDPYIPESILTAPGDLVVRGGSAAIGLPIGGANQVLHGGSSVPVYSAVVEGDISLSNITTNNATTVKHGFLPQLPGSTSLFLRGDGSFAAPGSVTVPNAYVQEAFAYTADTGHQIVHNFGTFPLVQCFDSTGLMVVPVSIQQIDTNTVELIFNKSQTYTVVLTLGSPPLNNYVNVSDDYTMLAGDYFIEETGAGKTVTLLTVVGRQGKQMIIKNTSSGNIDVVPQGGELIDTYSIITLAPFDALNVFADGLSTWHIF